MSYVIAYTLIHTHPSCKIMIHVMLERILVLIIDPHFKNATEFLRLVHKETVGNNE